MITNLFIHPNPIFVIDLITVCETDIETVNESSFCELGCMYSRSSLSCKLRVLGEWLVPGGGLEDGLSRFQLQSFKVGPFS